MYWFLLPSSNFQFTEWVQFILQRRLIHVNMYHFDKFFQNYHHNCLTILFIGAGLESGEGSFLFFGLKIISRWISWETCHCTKWRGQSDLSVLIIYVFLCLLFYSFIYLFTYLFIYLSIYSVIHLCLIVLYINLTRRRIKVTAFLKSSNPQRATVKMATSCGQLSIMFFCFFYMSIMFS